MIKGQKNNAYRYLAWILSIVLCLTGSSVQTLAADRSAEYGISAAEGVADSEELHDAGSLPGSNQQGDNSSADRKSVM